MQNNLSLLYFTKFNILYNFLIVNQILTPEKHSFWVGRNTNPSSESNRQAAKYSPIRANKSQSNREVRITIQESSACRDSLFQNFGIELSSQGVPPQVLSSIYNVSQLRSRWISVGPLSTLKTPKQK